MNYVFIGIQGSGKGTQARLLEQRYNFRLFESGVALRNIAIEDSQLGQSVKATIEEGNHVSPSIIEEIMLDILKNKLDREHAIFDGFVRNLGNKQTADMSLGGYTVVVFELNEKKAKERLLGRMYNPRTGETFPKGTLRDPNSEETLIKRSDDEESAIEKRIQLYIDLALPLLKEYEKEGKLIKINADQDIDTVHRDLVYALGL